MFSDAYQLGVCRLVAANKGYLKITGEGGKVLHVGIECAPLLLS